MTVEVRSKGCVNVLDVVGKLTFGPEDVKLPETFAGLLASGQRLFIFNLLKTSYIDSAGIGEILACYKGARQRDGTVKIVTRAGSKTHDLFVITRLNHVFELFSDEEEAIASFISGPVTS